MTRLYRRVARSSGDIWEMSGAGSCELGAVPPPPGAASETAPGSLLQPKRSTSTVTSAPSAAPTPAHGRPPRQPAACPPEVCAALGALVTVLVLRFGWSR